MQKMVLVEDFHLTFKTVCARWCCRLCLYCVPSPFFGQTWSFSELHRGSTVHLGENHKPPCFAALAPWAVRAPAAAVAACRSWQAALRRGRPFQHKICACPDCEALAGSRSWLRGGPTYAGDAGCAMPAESPRYGASRGGTMP